MVLSQDRVKALVRNYIEETIRVLNSARQKVAPVAQTNRRLFRTTETLLATALAVEAEVQTLTERAAARARQDGRRNH